MVGWCSMGTFNDPCSLLVRKVCFWWTSQDHLLAGQSHEADYWPGGENSEWGEGIALKSLNQPCSAHRSLPQALQVAGKAENRSLRALVLFKRAESLGLKKPVSCCQWKKTIQDHPPITEDNGSCWQVGRRKSQLCQWTLWISLTLGQFSKGNIHEHIWMIHIYIHSLYIHIHILNK